MRSKRKRFSGIRLTIANRLILSFLLVIAITGVVFIAAGIQLINNRIVAEAQEKVRYDLNAAREIYLGQSSRISDVVRFTADRFLLMNAFFSGDVLMATDELVKIRLRENLDVLTITDSKGIVLLRTSNLEFVGDDQSRNELVQESLVSRLPVAATIIVSAEDLFLESPLLAEKAYFQFIDTPMARPRPETEETSGMMLMAAAPILDLQNNLIGVVYGGVLLNRNFDIVDKVKQTVFQDEKYAGRDIGTATIFQDDVRISTNVMNADGTRAIGTRIAADVYDQVFLKGEPWIGRAYVVNDWYITAYEPIRDNDEQIIGILYVGILEQKYQDLQKETVFVFMVIALLGVLGAMLLAYFISRKISGSINKLAFASREIAHGRLDAKVDVRSNDELEELADTFNFMTTALKERDRQLKEFTTQKIMESERLAIIGQLAAGVAHELNNPLQGIVTYSHLLLEKMPDDDPKKVSIQKIVGQADRCREIIRGLLDFSRQRKPIKTIYNVNLLLDNCLSLVENQASFQNIHIDRNFHDDLPMVVIDPSQIERVFMNLIINAGDAMEKGGKLSLATRPDLDGKFIEVEISDTGHGISPENMEKIFNPFFTTKEHGHGVGLGLAISYGIVKEHQGTISVRSEVGKGTSFTIRLPVTVEEIDELTGK